EAHFAGQPHFSLLPSLLSVATIPLGLNDFGLAIREEWFNGKREPRTNGLQYADDASGGRCHTASTRAVGKSTRATRSAGTRRRAAVLVGGVRANLSSVLVP